MILNAFTTDKNFFGRAGAEACGVVFYAGDGRTEDPRAVNFSLAGEDYAEGDGCLLTNLSDDALVDDAIVRFSCGAPLIVSACNTLDEVGTFDKKFGMTPVGYAHRCGLLGKNSFIAGGVYLDRDDIDLIVQSGAGVILTPSDSMGSGCGIPPLRMLHTLGAAVRLGTGSGKYNPTADLAFETRLICLAASGMLCTRDPVPDDFIASLTSSEGIFPFLG